MVSAGRTARGQCHGLRRDHDSAAGWEGFEIVRVDREETAGGEPQVIIELTPIATTRPCGQCGRRRPRCIDTTVRRIRELPIPRGSTSRG